jgi:hypothetical protein
MPSAVCDVSKGISIFSWAQTLMVGLTQYVQSFSKITAGVLGGVTSFFDIYGAYEAYHNPEFELQRRTKMLSFLMSFLLNTTYTLGSVLKIISSKMLGVIAVGIDLVTLGRLSYITHEARLSTRIIKKELKQLQDAYDPFVDTLRAQGAAIQSTAARLEEAHDVSFKSKVEVAHITISLITSVMFLAGFFFPPLITAGLVTLIAFKVVHFIDNKTNLSISHGIGNLYKKCFPKKEKEFQAEYVGYVPIKKTKTSHHHPVLKKTAPPLNAAKYRFKQHSSNHYARLMNHPDKVIAKDQNYLPNMDPVLRLSR